MDNKRDFINVMNQCALIYDKDLIKTVIEAYWLLLREYDFDDFKDAMNQICRTSKFWPRPSEIIDVIEKQGNLNLKIETRADQQWRTVISAIRENGLNRPIEFDDPITRHLVSHGISWQYLCEIKQSDEKWEQKRFCRSYELLSTEWQTNPQIEHMHSKVRKLAQNVLKNIEDSD